MGAETSTMQNVAATTCQGCKNLGDKNVDTVKVDMSTLSKPSNAASGKENSSPGQMTESQAEKSPSAEQKRLKQAEEQEAARRRAEEEAAERQRLRVLEMHKQLEQENEMRKRQEEQERQDRIQKEQIAEQERLQAEEEQEHLRQVQKEEGLRLLKQQQVALKQKEEAEARRKNESLSAFLGKTGFSGVGEKKVKKSLMSSSFSYPLHAAVEQKDAEAVSLLLWAGADPKLPNSKKLTPLKLAEAKNKQGSHDKVIAALAA